MQRSFADIVGSQLEGVVFVATDELRGDLEARYGSGRVDIEGVCQPAT
ncbi:hypothetical protein SAMN05216276_108628 [Streptosporangium subroseum]|uniref:Uncharacterized protein n=1 Tax=Streptosporangium subroseum TaxID=106412 RepID=A0A239P5L1_9ACTN|nr:hypothetical protein [Streptosporangium subroseum]SNT61954.1 hypothetical protein SAMN05216276_108628 [Streptosporangium subroseum]